MMLQDTENLKNLARKIYLHWSGTHPNWKEPGHYHVVVTGDGKVHKLHPYTTALRAHTFARNENAVAFSLACMGGKGWSEYPPTKVQIEAMCLEVARLVKSLGWPAEKIDSKRIMTHAEAAALRDYPLSVVKAVGTSPARALAAGLPHENYGAMGWPDGWPDGTAERWDLWMLSANEKKGSGGDILRKHILYYYNELVAGRIK